MKRVALVLPELLPVPPVQGGAVEQWIHEATRRMDISRLDVTVFSRPAGEDGHAGVRYEGVPWTPSERWFQRLKGRVSRANPLRALAKIQNVWSYGRRVGRQLHAYDVVCLENDPNLLLFFRPRPGQRVVLHMHNEHLGHRWLKPLYRLLLRRVDEVLCVSDFIRRQAVQALPMHAERFKVLLNAADPEFFGPQAKQKAISDADVLRATEAPCVVYVGRLTPEKGVHVLLEAFSRVASIHPEERLVITGSSFFGGATRTPYQERLIDLVRHIQDRVIFTGFLRQDQVAALMARARAVVIPSVWQDPCPLVVLEAMASGVPVVATRVGGIPEMLCDKEAGVLVEPDDPAGLAQALDDVLGNDQRAAVMGAAARRLVVDRFSWRDLAIRFQRSLEG